MQSKGRTRPIETYWVRAFPIDFQLMLNDLMVVDVSKEVLYLQSLRPARDGDIPVGVHNSYNLKAPGTLITKCRDTIEVTDLESVLLFLTSKNQAENRFPYVSLAKGCAVEPIDVVLMTKKGGDGNVCIICKHGGRGMLMCCVKKKIQSVAHYFPGGVDSNLDAKE
ncbi:hypothetical protein C5167_021580 [Papaver somniferum]|nr:hypothetical protein C5167_021580 [Papaver somniferum]